MAIRVSGTKVFKSLAELNGANLQTAHPENPIYQQSSKIAEIAEIFTHVLDANNPFFEREYNAETKQWENTENVVKFSRCRLDREGGEGDDNYLGDEGRFEVSGANDSEYKLTYPVALTVNDKPITIADGSVGLTAFYRGSNVSRTRACSGGEGRVLVCLNGLWTTVDLSNIRHKQTKNWIAEGGPRQLINDGLQNIADTYKNYGADVEQMSNRKVSRLELHDCLMSAMAYNVVASSDLKKVHDIFNGKGESNQKWFTNAEPTAWRLYNSFTRYAEGQSSMQVRERVLGGLYWPMAKTGLIDLPKHVTYPADYSTICDANSVDDNHVTADQMLAVSN